MKSQRKPEVAKMLQDLKKKSLTESKAPISENVGEIADLVVAFGVLATAGYTALQAVKILGQNGDINMASLKAAYNKATKTNQPPPMPAPKKVQPPPMPNTNEIGMFNDPKGYDSNAEAEDRRALKLIKALIGKGMDKDTAIEKAAEKFRIRTPYLTRLVDKDEQIKEGDLDVGHQDDEPAMLKNKAYRSAKLAVMLYKELDKYDELPQEVDFPDWWQEKISTAKESLQSAYDYLDGQQQDDPVTLALEGDNIDNAIKSTKDLAKKAAFFKGDTKHGKASKDKPNLRTYATRPGLDENEEKVYIDFLNKDKGFKQDRIHFDSYEDAVKWGKENFERFDPDMIKYESVNEDHSKNPNDKYVVRPCKNKKEPWAVWEGETRVKGFAKKAEAKEYADKQNKKQGLTK